VNENDIPRVKLGDTATIEVDAWPDFKFSGVVTEIASSAKTTGVSADQVTNFDVKILVIPESIKDHALRPGMSATVDIRTETRNAVLAVPIQSVTTRTDTTKVVQKTADEDIRTIVFTTDGQRAFAKDVKTGIQDNSYIEILSGVSEGDRVVSAPYSAISRKLSDSTMVEIVKKEQLFSVK
jgi:HlyD family secretion protein